MDVVLVVTTVEGIVGSSSIVVVVATIPTTGVMPLWIWILLNVVATTTTTTTTTETATTLHVAGSRATIVVNPAM